MPIPYRDDDELDALGSAAYLTITETPGGSGYMAALFVINARGEPLEFTYNRIDAPHTFLWRAGDIQRYSERKLASSLLSLCPREPRLILCLASQVGSSLFAEDIAVSVPVCRIADALQATPYSSKEAMEAMEALEGPGPVHLFWVPSPPTDDSIERQLLCELIHRGLLKEPFERAAAGLREVHGSR